MKYTDLWQLESSFFSQFMNISLPLGGLTNNEYSELYALVALNHYKTDHNRNNMLIADVGCYTGLTTTLFANIINNNEGGKVWAIDWFKGNKETNLEIPSRYFNVKQVLIDNLEKTNYKSLVEILDKPSLQAVANFSDETFDVVFIDADHRYEEIKSDLIAWFPKVKKGGIICGHDCELILKNGVDTLYDYFKDKDTIDAFHLGVCRAVSEIFPDAKKTESGNIWFKKK